jgi:hypothetical protein
MAELPIADLSPIYPRGDGWFANLTLRDGDEEAVLEVAVSDTQRCISGLAKPTPEWIVERTRARAVARLSNYEPVLLQVRTWEQPLQLYAEPDRPPR